MSVFAKGEMIISTYVYMDRADCKDKNAARLATEASGTDSNT